MTKQAILFGSIGTLVETSELQRQAFNQAFEEAGLDWSWGRDYYRALLKNSGGEQRIKDYANAKGKDVDATSLHQRKTEIFDEAMIADGLSLRVGVAGVIENAKDNGIKLAFVTTTSHDNVDAIFEALGNSLGRDDFAFVGDASVTSVGKPSPDIYEAALNFIALDKTACVTIEDTGVSAKGAVAAGFETVGFAGEYADRDDFNAAVRVVDAVEYADLIGTG